MSRFILLPSNHFERKYRKLVQKNLRLKARLLIVLDTIAENPFHHTLKTHKVNGVVKDNVYSSKVTGDIRIIWEFNDERVEIIDLIDIGGHSGKHKVYK